VNFSKFAKTLFRSPFPQPDPAFSAAANATMWQLQGNVTIEYEDIAVGTKQIVVDLNSSRIPDPSSKT
jgi:hypothetical protein